MNIRNNPVTGPTAWAEAMVDEGLRLGKCGRVRISWEGYFDEGPTGNIEIAFRWKQGGKVFGAQFTQTLDFCDSLRVPWDYVARRSWETLPPPDQPQRFTDAVARIDAFVGEVVS